MGRCCSRAVLAFFLPHMKVGKRGDGNIFFNSSWESAGVIQARGWHLPRGITFGNSLCSSLFCFQCPPAHPSFANPLGQRIVPAGEPSREMLALKGGAGSQSTPSLEQPRVGGCSITCGSFARPLSTQGTVRRAVCLCVALVRAAICCGYI